MARITPLLFFLLLFLALTRTPGLCQQLVATSNQTNHLDNYLHRNWKSGAGLPQNNVNAIVQDGLGFLWVGTENGLARFDGQEFKVFDTHNTPALKSNRITSLLWSGDKYLWIGTAGGSLTIYENNRFRHFDRGNLSPTGSVQSITKGLDEHVIIGMSGGRAILVQGRSRSLPVENLGPNLPGDGAVVVLEDSQKKLWLGTSKGLKYFKDGKMTTYTVADGLADNHIRCFLQDKNGHLLIGTAGGLNRLIPQQPFFFSTVAGFGDCAIHALLADQEGGIWVASDRGLYRLSRENVNPRLEKVSAMAGLSGEIPVLSLYRGNDGIIWCGTAGGGLHSLSRSPFRYYTTRDGLSHNYVKTIYQDNQGNMWIGTGGGGLNRFDGKRFTVFTTRNGLCSNDITSLCQDGPGNLWIGTPHGLQRASQCHIDESLNTYTEKNGLSANAINVLFADRQGNLWIGTHGGGLLGYQNGRFFQAGRGEGSVPQEFAYSFVHALAQDNSGNLWVATGQGLLCLDIKTNLLLQEKKLEQLQQYTIREIFIDWLGRLWLATTGRGLICYDRGRVISFPGHSELNGISIHRIFEDNNGLLWLTSGKGLFAFDEVGFVSPLKDSRRNQSVPKLRYNLWLESDGLKSAVFTGGSQPAGWKTSSGELWLPTVAGITVIAPETTKLSNPIIPVVFEKVVVAGQAYHSQDIPRLPAGTTALTFYFTALNYQGFENLQYKYRLVNLSWGEEDIQSQEEGVIGASKEYTLQHLTPGKYRFEIYAGNPEKGWSEKAAGFIFSIEYQILFEIRYILIGIGILTILVVVIFWSKNRWDKKKEILRIFTEDERYKTSALKPRQFKKSMLQLLTLMEEEKPYLDAEMSVAKMAERLDISKEHVSQIINQKFYMNFNQFLNKYRIEEAKKRLQDPAENQYVVLKIAFDVGFNSKSTFNTAFKKFTGMSPSEYKEKFQPPSGPKS